jgi:hypothetical protein
MVPPCSRRWGSDRIVDHRGVAVLEKWNLANLAEQGQR